MLSDKYYIDAAAKSHKLGPVKLIYEFYKVGILPEKSRQECVENLSTVRASQMNQKSSR